MKQKFYNKEWFMWVMLIVFAPVGIWLLYKNPKYKNGLKIGISVVAIIIFFNTLSGFNKGFSDGKEQKKKDISVETVTKTNDDTSKTQANSSNTQNTDTSTTAPSNSLESKLEKAKVIRVVDGDTIEIDGGQKVRFIGMNTPESTTKHEPYGEEASNYTKSQLDGKTIWLEKDTSDKDKYGRLLRYIWLEVPTKENDDNEIRTKMFNAILVINGYAQVATYPPDVKYQEYFVKYNSEARDNNKGLWAINSNKETPKKDNPNNISSNNSQGNVFITTKGKKYHKAGCKTIKDSKTTQLTIEEAKNKGYEACKVCNP